MENNFKLALIVGYYAARCDREGIAKLGFDSFTAYFKQASTILNVKENSIRNMRDEFDPYFDNSRQGFNRNMSPSRKRAYEYFKGFTDEELTQLMRGIFNGETERIVFEMENVEFETPRLLKSLREIADESKKRFAIEFENEDIKLSEDFRHKLGAYLRKLGQNVTFNEGTVIITTTGNLKIYAPNQWFSMALYMKEYLTELLKYKNHLEKILNKKDFASTNARKDYIKLLKGSSDVELVGEFTKLSETYFSELSENEDSVTECVNFMVRFVCDYDWWFGSKTIDRGDFYVSPILNLLGVVNASQSYIAEIVNYYVSNPELTISLDRFTTEENNVSPSVVSVGSSTVRKTGGQNFILYGAPGTGKSRTLEDRFGVAPLTKRVVFHPEYSYFDFVGSYKPVTLYKQSHDVFTTASGTPFVKGEPYIDYKFVPGPFIEVLVDSWLDPSNMHTLLIEEINRANAASVFGEVFQLLDRLNTGASEYRLSIPYDLFEYLYSIEGMAQYLDEGLYIPSNMNIVATMNSADQGVNIIDSAFKRRWNFEYLQIDINNAVHKDAKIKYAGNIYRWGTLVSALNDKLIKNHIDEDRLIGPYFIKPEEVNKKYAVDKLLLYLWDDVLRHNRENFFNKTVKTFSYLSIYFEEEDVLALSEYISSYTIAEPIEEHRTDTEDGELENEQD